MHCPIGIQHAEFVRFLVVEDESPDNEPAVSVMVRMPSSTTAVGDVVLRHRSLIS
jgi:hypothetical protein